MSEFVHVADTLDFGPVLDLVKPFGATGYADSGVSAVSFEFFNTLNKTDIFRTTADILFWQYRWRGHLNNGDVDQPLGHRIYSQYDHKRRLFPNEECTFDATNGVISFFNDPVSISSLGFIDTPTNPSTVPLPAAGWMLTVDLTGVLTVGRRKP